MIFYDTNALLSLQDKAFHEKFLCSDVTLHEIEHIKTSAHKSEDVKYRARKLAYLFDENPDKYEVIVYTDDMLTGLPNTPINRIIGCAIWAKEHYNSVEFVSDDVYCKNIAHIMQLAVNGIHEQKQQVYTGYKEFIGTTEEINEAMTGANDWCVNEYVIIHNIDDDTTKEMRYDGEKFVSLKLPASKYIKGKNSLQRCALDLLNNPDITIAAVLGGYGSGKTYLSMKMGLYHVLEKGSQSTILGVREAWGEGREIGWLKGDFDDKTGKFFLPLAQQLDGGEFEIERLKLRGVLDTNIPYYMKGTTYNDTVIIVDEAEDLSEKQIKLIGTRLGENSRIFFAGDYKQSVINATENNALLKMCNELKGEPTFACIYLGEDVRSSASKLFASLFE